MYLHFVFVMCIQYTIYNCHHMNHNVTNFLELNSISNENNYRPTPVPCLKGIPSPKPISVPVLVPHTM